MLLEMHIKLKDPRTRRAVLGVARRLGISEGDRARARQALRLGSTLDWVLTALL